MGDIGGGCGNALDEITLSRLKRFAMPRTKSRPVIPGH